MPFTISISHDSVAASTALAAMIAQTSAAENSSDAFQFAFDNTRLGKANAGKTYLQACDGDLIVCMLVIALDNKVTPLGVAQVQCIITAPAYRRKGVATMLLEWAGKLAAENGKPIITINSAVQGHPVAFFTSMGFAVNSIEPDFASLPDGRITDTVTYWKRYAAGQ